MATGRAHTLLPPMPDERVGWGRLKHILRAYPTAPVELLTGFGNFARGTYVAWPGHHDAVPHFPVSWRLGLAIVMMVGGAVQVWATVYEKGWLRAACAVVIVGILVLISGIYSTVLQGHDDPRATTILFYLIFAAGEFWVACRTPELLPLRRLLGWANGPVREEEPNASGRS